jgi:hypothetical protein
MYILRLGEIIMNRKIIDEFKKAFPKAWVKDGREFDGGNAILWSGEGATLIEEDDGEGFEVEAFNPYHEDTMYEFGVHKQLVEWADKHGLHWEAYDAGTYLAYKN